MGLDNTAAKIIEIKSGREIVAQPDDIFAWNKGYDIGEGTWLRGKAYTVMLLNLTGHSLYGSHKLGDHQYVCEDDVKDIAHKLPSLYEYVAACG